jgi:TatD DNase family protein
MWADSHCHVPYEGVGVDAIAEAAAAGVSRIVTVGTNLAHSREAVAVADDHPGVWATVGVHPHDATEVGERGGLEGIQELARSRRVVAIGECGLDYHYDHSPREVQRDVFAQQVALARAMDLALVIHTREAWDDTFAVLAGEGVPERTVFHCFTGGPVEARRALDVGAWLSFSGIVTFKTAEEVREAAALCPLDRLLVETDAPFLAPVPLRGKVNRPAYVTYVGASVAATKGLAAADVEAATWANTAQVFGLDGLAAAEGSG